MAHLLKGKYEGVVFEFKRARGSDKTIILSPGLPSLPYGKDTIEFFNKLGFNVISIRYRGTWESEGLFLEKPVEKDLLTIVEMAKKGYFRELYEKKLIRFKSKRIVLVGGSFGGYASLLASQIKKYPVVAFAPPYKIKIDKKHKRFIEDGFGPCYRFSNKKIKLQALDPKKLMKQKILIVHGKKDKVVTISSNRAFYSKIKKGNVRFVFVDEGHSTSDLIGKAEKEIKEFLKKIR